MSFDRRGYLCSDLSTWTDRVRREEAEHFKLADAVSDLGVRVINHIEGRSRTPQSMFAGAYFLRGLQSLQGAIVMVERGMYVEAQTLLRSTFETLFYAVATLKHPEFVRRVGAHHVKVMNKLFWAHSKLFANMHPDSSLNQELEEARSAVNANGVEGRELSILEVAQMAGLEHVYDGFYRGLSSNAAHPGVLSLNSLWDDSGEGPSLQWGPDYYRTEALVDTVHFISFAGLLLVEQLNNNFIQSSEIEAEIVRLGTIFTSLYQNAEVNQAAH